MLKNKKSGRQLLFFCVLALGIELLWFLLLALVPFSVLHLRATPLLEQLSWLLAPYQQLAGLFHTSASFLPSLLFGGTLLGLIFLYLLALSLSRHAGEILRHPLLLLSGSTALFGVTLLFLPKLFSDDVFTYMIAGRIITVYGLDPYNTLPAQLPYDPYIHWVISGRNIANIYGPLWFCISALLSLLSDNPAVSLLLFKGFALLMHLLNTLLVWTILGRIMPRRQFSGTLLYAWNPLVLIELAGNGHSEGLLLLLLLLSVYCYTYKERIVPCIAAFLIFGLAISTNLIALLLAPLFLWFDVRHERVLLQAFLAFCRRLVLVLLPAFCLFLPFWKGAVTFFAITSAIDMQHFVHSPIGVLAIPLRALFSFFAQVAHIPKYINPVISADMTLRASATIIFVLIYGSCFGQVRAAYLNKAGIFTLFKSWYTSALWYLVLVSGWFWPWYTLWFFWMLPFQKLDTFSSTILGLTFTSLFIYAFIGFQSDPIAPYQTALIFGIPLAYLLISLLRRKHKERITRS
ncbi:hypothetical protein EI42_00880 [Thermosporothrix hazakensis]|jgi:hypothetical protein|uniref:Glycosyltransferase RgtA/B/C/D-like domain-containing protein n=1 Tax=Thermosporothrix hazakensis TaxID=644383 RepID=A0A326US41_THEHA|nr:hypothetical protein [Thermosporothrix hazakensis]PZW36699.1 hypothetical protein EI42_00880 [Thermosporothrix hazakensis]GCE47350.1 hypothetical protein KTH_22190 [Thermosporothrix hazakensis]